MNESNERVRSKSHHFLAEGGGHERPAGAASARCTSEHAEAKPGQARLSGGSPDPLLTRSARLRHGVRRVRHNQEFAPGSRELPNP